MNVIYHDKYNIDIGLVRFLHPFDGMKFKKVNTVLSREDKINVISPGSEVSMDKIDEFCTDLMREKIRDEVFIMRALEVPKLPFLNFSFIDKKVLLPMRWGVAGTILGAEKALQDRGIYWNISGGYHHAMPQKMEGFCIYNDVGICYQELLNKELISKEDKILIIDTDAHHGNGNANTFKDNAQVTILDVYNQDIYPVSVSTRRRVDFPVPLKSGVTGPEYLAKYKEALEKLGTDFSLAFVITGTDVLSVDKLGGFNLTSDDVVQRDQMTISFLSQNKIPSVMLSGGGYSKQSADCIAKSILSCSEILQK